VRLAGVQRDEAPVAEVQRDRRRLHRGEVDPQGVAVGGEQGGGLVEEAGLGTDPVVLDLRAQAGEGGAVGVGVAGQAEEREG
jgi:hypothetical protein